MPKYNSTRGEHNNLRCSETIIKGIAGDKGLYVPDALPNIGVDVEELAGASYKEIAKKVMGLFFDDFSKEEINACVDSAYDSKFDDPSIAPIKKAGGAYFLELYHGKTAAFKDMALSILPYFLTTSMKKEKENKKIVILTATSGDTGKAALEGFADVPNTEIIVFYPNKGVSEIQERQMTTQKGDNTHVFAVNGNFDDAQTAVKKIFTDPAASAKLAENGYKFSSANSINIGRLVPQVAYYVYSYAKLLKDGAIKVGDKINVVVPTGNFGNILAAYYAKQMGIPIDKLICASNQNKVLTDFINSGRYDANRDFFVTNSPSMDILISSNLERLLYHLSGNNAEEISAYMASLDADGCYEVSDKVREGMKEFYGGFVDVADTDLTIGKLYNDYDYLVDTHTAVAYKVYEEYRESTGDETVTVIASTASPYKFAESVAQSIGLGNEADGFAYVEAIKEKTGVKVPVGLQNLDQKPVRHSGVIDIDELPEVVFESLL
jgi:threonine synthase